MKRGIDYIGVGTGAMIFNKEGKIFIAQRGPKARNERGKWDFPGGSVEFGERCEDAIIREIVEEHDMEIEIISLLEVCNHIITEENQHWVSPSFIARHKSREPRIVEPEKCTAFQWIEISKINPDELTNTSRQNFNTYIKLYGYNPPKI